MGCELGSQEVGDLAGFFEFAAGGGEQSTYTSYGGWNPDVADFYVEMILEKE